MRISRYKTGAQLLRGAEMTNSVKLIDVGNEALYATGSLIAITAKHIAVLKSEVHSSPRQRVRICTHPGVDDALHEMFVCYTKEAKVAPHKHVGKDETFYVMEGEMSLILYNDHGDVKNILRMGDPQSGKAFCVRVPRDTYHTVILHSEYCVLHEHTPGPFDRADTVWASWGKV